MIVGAGAETETNSFGSATLVATDAMFKALYIEYVNCKTRIFIGNVGFKLSANSSLSSRGVYSVGSFGK